MRVLVTGGAGYIGSMLIPLLLDSGHVVRCVDRFFFGSESLGPVQGRSGLEIIKDDIRWFDPSILSGVDAVIDLAALSNDPSGELDPSKTYEINHLGRVRVARLGKEKVVKRYVLASTCSVYGFQNGILSEESPVNPLTTYAKANLLAEKDIIPLADDRFTVTVPRFATAYGLSRRMRFDLAINGMVLGLFKTGRVPVMRDGNQWRPFVHVKDIAKALLMIVEAQKEKVNGQIFNVGSNEQNYQIGALAKTIGESLPVEFAIEWYGSPDSRSYRVEFGKVAETLGFQANTTPRQGALEIYEALKDGVVTDSPSTRTVDWYKHMLKSHALVKEVELRGTIL